MWGPSGTTSLVPRRWLRCRSEASREGAPCTEAARDRGSKRKGECASLPAVPSGPKPRPTAAPACLPAAAEPVGPAVPAAAAVPAEPVAPSEPDGPVVRRGIGRGRGGVRGVGRGGVAAPAAPVAPAAPAPVAPARAVRVRGGGALSAEELPRPVRGAPGHCLQCWYRARGVPGGTRHTFHPVECVSARRPPVKAPPSAAEVVASSSSSESSSD